MHLLTPGQKVLAKNPAAQKAWIRDLAASLSPRSARRFIDEQIETFQTISMITPECIGKVFFYTYLAKYRETLPFWDKYPLIIVLDVRQNGSWLGLNLHYLPPFFRAHLLDTLFRTLSDDRMDWNTKLRVRYRDMKMASKYQGFKPCLKSYLPHQVRSGIVSIPPRYWDMVMFLPTAHFQSSTKLQKVTSDTVWQESLKEFQDRT